MIGLHINTKFSHELRSQGHIIASITYVYYSALFKIFGNVNGQNKGITYFPTRKKGRETHCVLKVVLSPSD